VAVVVFCLRLVPAISPAAVAPILLLTVLVVAPTWGTGPALLTSISAALAFSYFFLPPYGFGIQSPADWLTFISFTATAIVVGELTSRAERRRLEAQAGRREIERLYQELQAAFDRASEAEAARRSEQVKGALLDALTHNLRTPLTAIKAAVTALIGVGGSDGIGSRLSTESERELLQVIDEEGDRLNRFIEGLSGTTTGSAEPRTVAPIALEKIVRAGVARAETLTRDHRLVVSIDSDVPAVAVDPSATTEVLYILLDNASKYSPPGSTIRVTAGRSDEHHVRLNVTDEGPGIPPEYRERVFENFFKVPARQSNDPRRSGVGLGLPIARRLVGTQAGRLWIETPPSGRGTTFAFTLPAAVAGQAADDRPAAAAVTN
jgi:two-component system sensor histidine kinase KdpD